MKKLLLLGLSATLCFGSQGSSTTTSTGYCKIPPKLANILQDTSKALGADASKEANAGMQAIAQAIMKGLLGVAASVGDIESKDGEKDSVNFSRALVASSKNVIAASEKFGKSIDIKEAAEKAVQIAQQFDATTKNFTDCFTKTSETFGKGAELKAATENILKTVKKLDTTAKRTVRDIRDISNNAQDGYERNLKKTAAAASCVVASSALAFNPSCCAAAVCCASSVYLFSKEAQKVVKFLMHNGSAIALAPTPIPSQSTLKTPEEQEQKKKD